MDFTGYNGTIAVNDDQLTITHAGLAARTGGLVRDRPRQIPLGAISGINFKGATRMVNGWLTLGLGGAEPIRLDAGMAASDANTVMFRHGQKEDFEKLRDLLLSAIEKNQLDGVDPSTVAFDAPEQSRSVRLQGTMDELTESVGLARGFGFTLFSDRIQKDGIRAESHPLAGVSAQVESAEELQQRVTVTRLALTGVFAFALKKKSGGTSYLTIQGPGFAWVEEVERKQRQQAVEFAAKVRAAATRLPRVALSASQPIQPGPVDVTDQIRKLGELHAAGVLTDEEFSAKKSELLDRL